MCVEVLARQEDVIQARAEIRRRRIGYVVPKPVRILYKARLLKGVSVGDVKKSWDVLKTIEFLEARLAKKAALLDIGAYASEILCSFHKLGFSDLTGVDLNPRVTSMPYSNSVKYMVGDLMRMQFPPESFEAVTAISVLEHGFCSGKVFSEVSRVLKPGGYFVGSVDYWPEKIDTTGINVFGVDWTIFSEEELLKLVTEASGFGLVPVGPLDCEASERVTDWSGRQFTFAWFAFQKIHSGDCASATESGNPENGDCGKNSWK